MTKKRLQAWDQLSNVSRLVVVSIVPAVWIVWVWLFTTFETAQSSEQKWSSHNQAIACKTVYELRAQIRAKEAQIQFDKTLTQADRDFILKQIENVLQEIARIDPEGKC